MALILSQAEATAVRDAMCVLNNIGARLETNILGGKRVLERNGGAVAVIGLGGKAETYVNQDAFFAAYGIGEPVSS